ncbi:MAG: hypothetical protein DDT29_00877 [Dehalococcoidia bacterium]|nr:hypothetical protein [Bacillota bacterium]
MLNELQIRYNTDWKGRPYNAGDLAPAGIMLIHLGEVFRACKTKKGNEKLVEAVRGKKLLEFVLRAGSEEQIEYLRAWLDQNSKPWLKKFEEVRK